VFFVCFCEFFHLGPVCLFCVFGVFSVVCFELSVPVQVIAWKDSSLKWPTMCWVGCKTTHLLSFSHLLNYSEVQLVYSVIIVCYIMKSISFVISSMYDCIGWGHYGSRITWLGNYWQACRSVSIGLTLMCVLCLVVLLILVITGTLCSVFWFIRSCETLHFRSSSILQSTPPP